MTIRLFVLTLVVFVVIAFGVGAWVWEQFRQRDAALTAVRVDLRTTESELTSARSAISTFEEANQRLSGDLQKTNGERDEALAKGRTLQADLLAQHRENSQLQAAHVDLAFQLDDSEARNVALSEANDGLKVQGERLVGELADAHEVNELLEVDYQELQTVNNALDVDYQDLQSTHIQQTQALEDSQEGNRLLEGRNRQLASDLSDTESSLALLRSSVRSLQSVEQRRDNLQSEIAGLESQINGLEGQINGLEGQINGIGNSRPEGRQKTVACGLLPGQLPMHRKITCLDSATMLRNFRPEDIKIGTVISFKPTAKCDSESESVSHRVLHVKVTRGVYYFWPKGDNSDKADGCWIPESNVNGYIIKIHKNTRMKNANLRNSVNAAEDLKDKSWNDYARWYESYCGFPPNTGRTCSLPQRQIDDINRYASAYRVAFAYYACWVESAANVLPYGNSFVYKTCTYGG